MVLFYVKKEGSMNTSQLVGIEGEVEGCRFPLTANFTIGRSEGNTLILKDKAVSSFHAKIEKIGGYYEIQDLGSKNHTRVNNRRIFKATQLRNGDLIKIGFSIFRFECHESLNVNSKDKTNTSCGGETIVLPPNGFHIDNNVWENNKRISFFCGNKTVKLISIILVCLMLIGFVFLILLKSHPTDRISEKKHLSKDFSREEAIKKIWDTVMIAKKNPDYDKALELLDYSQYEFVIAVFESSFKPEDLWRSYIMCLESESYTANTSEFESILNQILMLKKTIQSEIEFHEKRCYNLYWINKEQGNFDKALEAIINLESIFDINGCNHQSDLAIFYKNLKYELLRLKGQK